MLTSFVLQFDDLGYIPIYGGAESAEISPIALRTDLEKHFHNYLTDLIECDKSNKLCDIYKYQEVYHIDYGVYYMIRDYLRAKNLFYPRFWITILQTFL